MTFRRDCEGTPCYMDHRVSVWSMIWTNFQLWMKRKIRMKKSKYTQKRLCRWTHKSSIVFRLQLIYDSESDFDKSFVHFIKCEPVYGSEKLTSCPPENAGLGFA